MTGQYLALRIAHHHLAELIKVHGARTILIQFFNDSIEFIRCEGCQQFADKASEGVGGDVALALLVVDSETFLKLLN